MRFLHTEVTFLDLMIAITGQKLDSEHLVLKKVKFIIEMSSEQEQCRIK